MARRRAARQLAALAEVQRVRVLAAEAALTTARTGEEEARTAEHQAATATLEAQAAWQHCLDRSGFAPELARAFAAALLHRDHDEAAAGERTRLATGLHERRRADWHRADACADATDDAHAAARRAERRRRDERALAAVGDRISFRWSGR